jgi:hypothetical protein
MVFFSIAFININNSPTDIKNSQILNNNLIFLSAIDTDLKITNNTFIKSLP